MALAYQTGLDPATTALIVAEGIDAVDSLAHVFAGNDAKAERAAKAVRDAERAKLEQLKVLLAQHKAELARAAGADVLDLGPVQIPTPIAVTIGGALALWALGVI